MKTPATTYTYTDQNNNRFFITAEMISYDPISPEESSSGTYSGGTPKRVALKTHQYNDIVALAEAIFDMDKGKTLKRAMMTSILSTRYGNAGGTVKTVILTKSKARTALENYLIEVKGE